MKNMAVHKPDLCADATAAGMSLVICGTPEWRGAVLPASYCPALHHQSYLNALRQCSDEVADYRGSRHQASHPPATSLLLHLGEELHSPYQPFHFQILLRQEAVFSRVAFIPYQLEVALREIHDLRPHGPHGVVLLVADLK